MQHMQHVHYHLCQCSFKQLGQCDGKLGPQSMPFVMLQVLAMPKQAFLVFLEDTQQILNIMTQHAAR